MELGLDEFLLKYFSAGLPEKPLKAETLKDQPCNPAASIERGFVPGFTGLTF